MVVVGIGFVGADNSPIYVHRFDNKDSLDLHFVLNSSLDVFEETLLDRTRSASQVNNASHYLGLLCLLDQYAVYGYCATTRTKIILVINAEIDQDAMPREGKVKTFLESLYYAYVDAMSNPFVDIGTSFRYDTTTETESQPSLSLCMENVVDRKIFQAFLNEIETIVKKHHREMYV